MSYLGKTYTLEKQEKFDQFLAALGVKQELIDSIVSEKSAQSLAKDGDTYKLTMSNKTTSFQSGVEFDETINGKPCKTTFVVDSNIVTQTQKFPDDVTITFKKQYADNKLVVEATSSVWDGVAYRYYSA